MFLQWLKTRLRPAPSPRLQAIFIAPGAGLPMQSVPSASAIEGRGVEGDRYHDQRGHWQSIEGCQLTVITTQELQQAQKKTDLALDNGCHRRNLVIDGIRLRDLEGRQFRIGGAVLAYQKPRPPCGYIDQVAGKGIGRALSHNSGICVKVIESGELAVGDALNIIT